MAEPVTEVGSADVCRIKRYLRKRGAQGWTPVRATASVHPRAGPEEPAPSAPPQVAACPSRSPLLQQEQRTAHLQALCTDPTKRDFCKWQARAQLIEVMLPLTVQRCNTCACAGSSTGGSPAASQEPSVKPEHKCQP